MKRVILILSVIVVLLGTSSCSQCNRTGQMIQWRERGAVQAAQTLAPTDSLDVSE